MATQVLCAHLPLLIHPSPKRVMMLGLASGVTAGSVLRHPIARLDCVEISPEVVRASRYFVGDSGLDYAGPRFHLIIDDARNWLALSDESYDVIIIEPTNPWVAGLGSLFTREFYKLLRDHLSPGGVALAWIPAYDMDAETVRLSLRTFAGVFPETTVWELIPGADYFMIGSVSPLRVDLAAMEKRAAEPAVAEDLARVGVARGRDLFTRFLMGPDRTAATAGAGPVHTDDRLQLEFALPRLMTLAGEERARGVYRAVLSHHEPAFGIVTPDAPEARAALAGFDQSRSLYYRAFFGDLPGGRTGLDEVIAARRLALAASPGRFPEEFARRDLALALGERAERRLVSGDGRGAVADWEEAFGLDPEKVVAGDRLINYYLGLGDEDGAGEWARRTLARLPREPFALLVLARSALAAGDYAQAEAHLRAALQVLPRNPQYRMELGRVLARQGRLGEAEAEAWKAAAADPSSAEAQDLLSRVLAGQGRMKEAEKCQARAEELRRKKGGR